MGFNLLRGRQPNFQHKNKNSNLRAIMSLNLILGLHTLPSNPKVCLTLFAISLSILLVTAGTTLSTSSPQPLQCKAGEDKLS